MSKREVEIFIKTNGRLKPETPNYGYITRRHLGARFGAMHRIIKSGRLNLTTGTTGSLFTFGISSRRSRDDQPARAAATSGRRGRFLPPGRLHRGATNGATRRRCSVARPVTPRVALCIRAIRIALWSSASGGESLARADRAEGTACLEETRL